MLPPRRLAGVLFGAAGTVWWFLISLLSALIAPEDPVFSQSFWTGWLLVAAASAGWGAVLGRPLARRAGRGASAAGMVRFAVAGGGILLLAGVTALGLGLALSALVAGTGRLGATLRAVAAQPGQLVLPAVSLLLIAAPLGGAAGVAWRAMAAPGANGSTGPPLR